MNIFLSYASEDRSLVEPIYYELVKDHHVFFDKKSLPTGKDFVTRIRKAIHASDLMVFFISPNSVEPGFTITELGIAEKKWKSPEGKVLPVLLRQTPIEDIPKYLSSVSFMETKGHLSAEIAIWVSDLSKRKMWKRLISSGIGLVGILLIGFLFIKLSDTGSKTDSNFSLAQIESGQIAGRVSQYGNTETGVYFSGIAYQYEGLALLVKNTSNEPLFLNSLVFQATDNDTLIARGEKQIPSGVSQIAPNSAEWIRLNIPIRRVDRPPGFNTYNLDRRLEPGEAHTAYFGKQTVYLTYVNPSNTRDSLLIETREEGNANVPLSY